MEKQTQYHHHQQQQQVLQQQTLKCPRCDSSNTKFCYYNNYNLSQPRHFCKACKRYWTKGGTLRNVPVGGGCRKNKKVKKRSISTVDSPSSSLPTTTTTTTTATTITTNPNLNPPLFYGVPTNPSYYNFNNFKAMNMDEVSGYDLQTQMNIVHELGFTNSTSVLSSYPVFGSSSISTSMASLVTSSLEQQQKYVSANSFLRQAPHEHDMKTDETQNKMDWCNIVPNSLQNQIQQIGSSSDSSLLWMLDPANLGSSVPSLI